ncbi:jupiter microtubule associated homolog 2 isoform X2 [Amblyraja radiata]|uniref:jupiter microtubule associated homolog 2 isoform X2 n=1 Tax=Amblyraja radiata TaxID=386614 RepID=UPI001403B231|nr:jupiter microtubule associated homolog 2 isoform X2 [Amblyraja radiata]
MTSTSTFQGLESRPSSSRVLKPPGGDSSNIFGVPEEPSTKPHKMASNIFGPPEEISLPKKSNPPGGKESGIFTEVRPDPSQSSTISTSGKNSDIFGEPAHSTAAHAHPNKPKDTNIFSGYDENNKLKVTTEHGDQVSEKKDEEKQMKEKSKELTVDDHEPRLGPRPRSHNKVSQPPGGRSTFSLF